LKVNAFLMNFFSSKGKFKSVIVSCKENSEFFFQLRGDKKTIIILGLPWETVSFVSPWMSMLPFALWPWEHLMIWRKQNSVSHGSRHLPRSMAFHKIILLCIDNALICSLCKMISAGLTTLANLTFKRKKCKLNDVMH